jgi:polyhydroxyalkanoate synthesis regulator phasin
MNFDMNSDNLVQQLQKGLRIAIGATTSLVESIQDSLKRDENVAKLRTDWTLLAEEWAEKGAVTEQEARSFVDNWMAQQGGSTASSPSTVYTSQAPTTSPDIKSDLQELTEQIAAIRLELEKMRGSESSQ